MKGVILAAGYGTRFRPLTYTLPKPLLPLCNRPLIGWAIESYLAAGVSDIIINLHHLPEPIREYVRVTHEGRARFSFSHEAEILGTGGAIRRIRPLLEGEEDFFLVNGDTVQFPRYGALAAARRADDALAALTLRHPPENDRFTAVWFENGLVNGFGEGHGQPLMFAGSHALSTRVLRHLPDREFSGIVGDVYQPVLRDGIERLAGVVDDGLWFDIGTPRRYLSASRTFLEATARDVVAPAQGSRLEGDSLLHETATVAGSVARSAIGAGSTIRGVVEDCAIWDGCTIGEKARLRSCIVAHGVEITGPLELSNALICRDDPAIPQDSAYERRDGLVLLNI